MLTCALERTVRWSASTMATPRRLQRSVHHGGASVSSLACSCERRAQFCMEEYLQRSRSTMMQIRSSTTDASTQSLMLVVTCKKGTCRLGEVLMLQQQKWTWRSIVLPWVHFGRDSGGSV